MALFGFNKAKTLAAAEKYVQQGKLSNAIAEYEKIIEKDSKDLTVLNTIGDLYGRLGQAEKAGEYFRKVGDCYASDGFTVKAIAMYKKLTKLNPGAISVVQRLAELYTQQGLYNDARQQYLILADNHIKNNDVPNATRIFQKMLEMDPDNTSLQSKLADLYLKSGKKTEARDIYFHAARSLYERNSVEQADHQLERVLSLDSANTEALLLRGKIALDRNNGMAAATLLEQVADIDQRPEGLQALLRAYILSNDAVHAEGIARKLATVHNDLGGVRLFGEFLMSTSQAEKALAIYDEFVDRLVVGDTGELTLALQGLSNHLKERPESLEKLRNVLQKAGANAAIPDVKEQLAHAYVKAGQLGQARDLYKELADLEPSNPQHMQNYRQVLARMGEDPAAKPLGGTDAGQALFVEEIVDTPLPPTPEYPAALMEKISNVLTDAELFESYNKPQQAVAPLEAILQQAPQDVRINQRLLSVYSKLERIADAATRCEVLQEIYDKAGMATEAKSYADMAVQLRGQSEVSPQFAAAVAEMPVVAAPVAEEMPVVVAPAVPIGEGEAHEIDLSSEWESAVEGLPSFPVSSATPEPAVAPKVEEEEVHPSAVADLLEEITFYLDQRMWDEAKSAVARCERLAPANFQLSELKQQLQAEMGGSSSAAEVQTPSASVPAEEASVMEYDFETAMAAPLTPEAAPNFDVTPVMVEAPVAESEPAPMAVVAPEPEPEFSIEAAEPVTEKIETLVDQPEEVAVEPAPHTAMAPQEIPAEPEEQVESEEVPVAELEPEPVMMAAPETVARVAEPREKEDLLSDLVMDLEESLPADFGSPGPKVIPMREPAPMLAAAVASGGVASPVSAVAEAVAVSRVVPQMAASAATAVEVAPSPETNTMLSDLFEEFKEDVGEAQEEKEDPDTHYNLGVAFKEMGLLDEAIGELQKVCKAIDNGSQFSQVMQAYTWLANCFVEKGVPEASVKWYEKALTIAPGEDSRTALHYDLANAFEAAGNRNEALKHFTEVYGTNIDYRDVAERIKALKS
jgi:pilus assembly protein FimV